MKKIIFFVLISCLFSVFAPDFICWAAEEAQLSLTPAQSELLPGQEIILDLNLNSPAAKIYSLDLKINYPSEKLVFNGLDVENSLVTNWAKNRLDQNGSLNLIGGVKTGFSGQGKIARLRFITKAAGQAVISLLPASLLLDQNQQNVFKPGLPANIKINNPNLPVATNKPQVSLTPTPVVKQIKKNSLSPIILFSSLTFLVVAVIFFLYQKSKKPPVEENPPNQPLPPTN